MSTSYALSAVKVASSPRERFLEYLHSKGKRVTQQRLQLVDLIFKRHDHFDADEVCLQLTKLPGKRISRATVYRTLEELVEAGLLFTMNLGGRAVYDFDYGYPRHDHLYCQVCEKLIEFQAEELLTIRENAAREHGFRVAGHRLIVTGVCHECSQKRHRQSSPLDLV